MERGRERSGQLRANKRGFFKIASPILENHRLLLSNCFTPMIHFVPIYDRRTKCRSEILDKN